MFNKSEIMKRAWEIYRQMKEPYVQFGVRIQRLGIPFNEALMLAWEEARNAIWAIKAAAKQAEEDAKKIRGDEIKPGDVLYFEYGDYDHWVTAQVIGIRDEMLYGSYVVDAVYSDGRQIDFCIKPDEKIQFVKRAQSSEMKLAA